MFFSKIRAPGRVRTANLTLGKDKAYHFTLVWLGPVIRAHASPGWAPLHLPPAAPRHPARESHTNIHHVKLEMIKKTKCSSAQLEGIEPGPYCSCKVSWTTMPLQRLFPVLWFSGILYYLATRQLWTTYISNIVKSYKIFMSALYIHKMILWLIKYEFYTIFLINSGGTCSSNWSFFL